MRDALVSLGIPEERIILEERSRTTRENLLYSLMLIPESASVVLLTNDFHAFRACRHAIRKGVRASVETVRCPKNDLPLAFLREELAVIIEFFLGRL